MTGNARFKGFAVDMMKELAKGRSWTYRMELVPDEVTGTRLPNGSWSGMIGQLMTNVSIVTTLFRIFDLNTPKYRYVMYIRSEVRSLGFTKVSKSPRTNKYL